MKSGETFLTPNKETRVFLPEGASVIPHHDLIKNLTYQQIPELIEKQRIKFDEILPYLSNISDTIKSKKETHINITEKGFYTIVKNGNSQSTYINSKFRN